MKPLAVLSATVLVGLGCGAMSCSSNSGTGGSSGGGTTSSSGGATSSSGGATSSSGGVKGTGGSKSNTGGSTSTSTSTSAPGCTSANTQSAPPDNLIGDFAGDAGAGDAGGLAIAGGISVWGGSAQPTWSVDGDTLTLTENAAATSSAQYVGSVLYFNKCVDAVAYSGVEFTLSGTMSGCTLVYSANYSGTTDSAVDSKGTCKVSSTITSCYAPQKSLTVSSSPTQVRIGWDDTTGGSPVGPVDESKLTGLQWQFTIPGGSGTCSASITISNLKFY